MIAFPLAAALTAATLLLPSTAPTTTPTDGARIPASYTLKALPGLADCAHTPEITALSPSGRTIATTCTLAHGGSVARVFTDGVLQQLDRTEGRALFTIDKVTFATDAGILGGIVSLGDQPGSPRRGAVWGTDGNLRVGPTDPAADHHLFTDVTGVDAHGNAMVIDRRKHRDGYFWWKADGTVNTIPHHAWLRFGSADGTRYSGMIRANVNAGRYSGTPVTWHVDRGLRHLALGSATPTQTLSGWVNAQSPSASRIVGTVYTWDSAGRTQSRRSVEYFEDCDPRELPLSPAGKRVAPSAINDAGLIVGNEDTRYIPPSTDGASLHHLRLDAKAVVISGNQAATLETRTTGLPTGASLMATHIDSAGRIYARMLPPGDHATPHLVILTPKK